MCSQEYEGLYALAVKARETQRKTAPAPWEESGKSPATPADLRESQTDRHARESAARAARITGVSARAVQQAKAITRDTPDLAEQVRAGTLALDAADRQRRQRLEALPKPDPMPKPGLVMLTLRTHDGRQVPYPKPTGKATFTEAEGGAAWSWSPVTGCLHGCAYCWAREIATGERHRAAFPAGFSPLFHPERLDAPAHTTIPAGHQGDPTWRRVIVCPLADLYGPWVPDEWITRVHAAMCAHGRWQYVTQTRFPARYIGLELPPGAWVGTSVDAQGQVRAAEEAARRIDAPVIRWLSLEPLREPLSFTDLSLWDWVVIGAQTETRQPDGTVPAFAPPFDWVARLVTAARDAGCRVYLKPTLLGRTDPTRPGMRLPDEYPTPHLPADTGDAAAAPPGNGNL
jgi:protein gp37